MLYCSWQTKQYKYILPLTDKQFNYYYKYENMYTYII